MNKGKWNGKRIIPKKLVDEAMAEYVKVSDSMTYGFQVWRPSYLINGERVSLVQFSGNGGQFVQMDERNRTMVVVTAGDYNARGLKKFSVHIYGDIVYPAMLDRKIERNDKADASKR